MAGETIKSEAICLDIRPWSRTSHIVTWLTPHGKVGTVVKGAVRPKSAFLGQYDLNYTCEILYYARAKGDLHALRECTPTNLREALRRDYRALVLSGYFRQQAETLAPNGPEAAEWYELLAASLDRLTATTAGGHVRELLKFDLRALELSGLSPELEADSGAFSLRGERQMPVAPATAAAIRDPDGEKNPQILLDAARVIGVFYKFHLDCALDVRRMVLGMIYNKKDKEVET